MSVKFCYQVRRFFRVLFARFAKLNLTGVSSVLNAEETSLFLQMSVADQQHALDVYHAICQYSQKHSADVNVMLLKKAALLHDVGKSKFQISILDRVLAVFPPAVLRVFFPGKFLHVQTYREEHAVFSAQMLSDEKLSKLVLEHQTPPQETDSMELAILKQFDAKF